MARNASSAEPLFVADTVAGTTKPGLLARLDESGALRLVAAGATEVPAGELIALRRADAVLPPPPSGPQVVFVNGDRVPVEFVGFVGDRVRVRLPAELTGDRDVALSPTAVSLVWLVDPDNVESPARLRRRLAGQPRPRDRVLLRNGDAVEGVLLSADATTVEVEDNRKPVRLPRDRVAAVALSSELAADLKPKGPFVRVVLADGTRLSLVRAASDGRSLTGMTLFDSPVSIGLDRLVSLTVHQGAAVYLSDLKPLREESKGFSPGLTWPAVRDGNADGLDLLLGGSTFDKGLGTHGESRLTYDVSGFRRFESLVGLDDAAGRLGSVRIKVLIDGKPVDSVPDRELTLRDGPLAVSVPLNGGKELTLAVQPGRRLDVGDHVNWANARLVK